MEVSYKKGKKVAYLYNPELGRYYYGKNHPMKPKRVAMAHSLITNFGLYRELDVYNCRAATEEELCAFHDKGLFNFINNNNNNNNF